MGSAMEGGSLAGAAGATSAASGRPRGNLLCCGCKFEGGSCDVAGSEFGSMPPSFLFECSRTSRECIGGCRALKAQIRWSTRLVFLITKDNIRLKDSSGPEYLAGPPKRKVMYKRVCTDQDHFVSCILVCGKHF